jgi:hypothetical protein
MKKLQTPCSKKKKIRLSGRMCGALYADETARLNFVFTMIEMTVALLDVLEDFAPAYLTSNGDPGDEEHVGLVLSTFRGRSFDFERTWTAMAAMDADDDENARKVFQEHLLLVLDGTGTVIYEPNQTLAKMQINAKFLLLEERVPAVVRRRRHAGAYRVH